MLEEEKELKEVSGATDLPLASRERAWNAVAARRRMLAAAGGEDNTDWRKYRRGFFWYDEANAENLGAYKLPFADVIGGTLTAIPRAIFAVAAVLQGSRGGVDIPEKDKERIRGKVSRYYARMRQQFQDDSIVPPWEKKENWEDLTQRISREELLQYGYDPAEERDVLSTTTPASSEKSSLDASSVTEPSLSSPETVRGTTYPVKILENTKEALILGGYGFVWGGRDLQGEYFTPRTDFWFDRLTYHPPVLYHHGQDEALGRVVLGRVEEMQDDGIGLYLKMRLPYEPIVPLSKQADELWMEQQRKLHRFYLDSIQRLVEEGIEGISSGSVGHLVEITSNGEICSWPTVEFSLTPTPAEPRTLGIVELRMLAEDYEPSFKSLIPAGGTEKGTSVIKGGQSAFTTSSLTVLSPSGNKCDSQSTEKVMTNRKESKGDDPMSENVVNGNVAIDYDILAEKIAQRMSASPEQPDPGVIARNREAAKQVQVVPPGKFKSLGEQLVAVYRAVQGPGSPDNRLKATGLQEGVPSDGGFLVQEDFAADLLRRTYETGVLSSRVRRLPISANSNGIKINAIDETSRANGSRFGGVQAYWTAEAQQMTGSRPKFRQITLELQKLTALCYATEELLADAVALQGVIQSVFPEEMNFKMDDAIVRGTGAGMPLGILNSDCLVTVPKETGQAADTIVAENIVKMWSRMWGRSRANAVWLINQDCEPQLFTMSLNVGTGGIPVYMPANGLSTSPYATLMGRPVIPCEQCATVGDLGDILLVDLGEYAWIDKGAIDTALSVHVQFLYGETVFRFIYRADGQPTWSVALTPYLSSNTLSPFVALEARS